MVECLTCGCRDCELVRGAAPVVTTGGQSSLYRCRHCRAAFYSGEEAGVGSVRPVAVFLRTACPVCGSINTTQKTSGPKVNAEGITVRQHKCLNAKCKTSFTSREVLK